MIRFPLAKTATALLMTGLNTTSMISAPANINSSNSMHNHQRALESMPLKAAPKLEIAQAQNPITCEVYKELASEILRMRGLGMANVLITRTAQGAVIVGAGAAAATGRIRISAGLVTALAASTLQAPNDTLESRQWALANMQRSVEQRMDQLQCRRPALGY